jgi:hypothetical protein
MSDRSWQQTVILTTVWWWQRLGRDCQWINKHSDRNHSSGEESSLTAIHKLIWSKEELTDQWKKPIIARIHRKEDKTDCNNYRGLSLLSNSYQVFYNIHNSTWSQYCQVPGRGTWTIMTWIRIGTGFIRYRDYSHTHYNIVKYQGGVREL